MTLPPTIVLVDEFTDNQDRAVTEAKVTYQSKDNKIASVTDNGTVVAKAKGTTESTVIIELASGETRDDTRKVSVNDPTITFTKAPAVLALGSKEQYEIVIEGYEVSDITWMTLKRDIAVVGKNKGKRTANVTGKTKGTDYVAIYVNGVKVETIKVVVK